MNHDHPPEADWKIFRELREVALDRFCQRVVNDVKSICQDSSRSHHERYLAIYRLTRKRDKELAQAFDGPRRSRMLLHLALMKRHGLLEPEELAPFTSETRKRLKAMLDTFL